MWLQRLTNYLLEHRYRTIALVFFATFIPLIGMLSIVVAAFITLRKGAREGAYVTIAATLPYVISLFLPSNQETAIPVVIWSAIGVAVLSNILTWVFSVMLLRRTGWSALLQIAALLGVLAVSIAHLTYPAIADWWGTQLTSYYMQASQTMSGVMKVTTATMSSDTQLETINSTKQIATGVMVVGVLFNAILQLVIARWWQAAVFSPGSLRRELQRIRLRPLTGVMFVLGLSLTYYGNSVVLDMMPVLCSLFFVAGLSLIHFLFGMMTSNTRWFWLMMLYFVLIFAMPVSFVMVAVLALFDIWVDFRKRMQKV